MNAPLTQQVAHVRRLADYLGNEGQCLDPLAWGQRFAEYERAAAQLEAQASEELPLAARQTCWRCGGATFPEPNGNGRRFCAYCSQHPEEVPHPAECAGNGEVA